jgi:hypothetical protein
MMTGIGRIRPRIPDGDKKWGVNEMTECVFD